MEDVHTDYFLRRILLTDANKRFETSKKEFNTSSRTLKEFVREDNDCNDDGIFITYIFGKVDDVLGIARMRSMSFGEFKKEILERKMFNLEEIEEYSGLQIIYMSRVGVSKEVDGFGFGTMLRFFLDGHARTIFDHFLLYAFINESMFNSMIQIFGEKGFFENYKISRELYNEKWKKYWVILREFIPPL